MSLIKVGSVARDVGTSPKSSQKGVSKGLLAGGASFKDRVGEILPQAILKGSFEPIIESSPGEEGAFFGRAGGGERNIILG